MKAYHATALAIAVALAASACAKSCEGEAPRAKGTASASVAKLAWSSPAKPASVERFFARRLRALNVDFYRVSASASGASVEIDRANVASLERDVEAALRVDVHLVDESARPFAGHEAQAPFPAISKDGALETPRDHEASLARFVTTIAAPEHERILLGASAGDDFVHTWVVVLPVSLGGESIDRAELANQDGTWGLALTLDPAGRDAFGDLARASSGRRLVVAIDGRVRAAPSVESATSAGRVWIALGDDEGARAEGQRLLDRMQSGARSSDLALATRE